MSTSGHVSHTTCIFIVILTLQWAKARCTSFTLRNLEIYGGNKCGYSIDELTCFGPK